MSRRFANAHLCDRVRACELIIRLKFSTMHNYTAQIQFVHANCIECQTEMLLRIDWQTKLCENWLIISLKINSLAFVVAVILFRFFLFSFRFFGFSVFLFFYSFLFRFFAFSFFIHSYVIKHVECTRVSAQCISKIDFWHKTEKQSWINRTKEKKNVNKKDEFSHWEITVVDYISQNRGFTGWA